MIALDSNTAIQGVSSSTSITYPATVGDGSNRYLTVFFATFSENQNPTVATYDGAAMSLIKAEISQTVVESFYYGVISPPVGTANVVFEVPLARNLLSQAHSWFGVDQANPFRTPSSVASNLTTNLSASLSPESQEGDVVVDGVGVANIGTITKAGSQILLASGRVSGINCLQGCSYLSGDSPTTTMGWSWQYGSRYAYIAFAMVPSGAEEETVPTAFGAAGISVTTPGPSAVGCCL